MHSASVAWPLTDRVSEAGLTALGVTCAAIGASPFVAVPLLLALVVAGVDLDGAPILRVAVAVIVGLLASTFVVAFAACPRERIVAGERVLAHEDGDAGVDLQRLSRIEVQGGRRHPWLVLTQRAEPGTDDPAPALRASLAVVARDPQLWTLVQRGLRFSVANGAVADGPARELLGLPPGP